ncbi:MAG: hypothetical protein K1X55_10645 [Chitinophagales bacterium]|nr:hypothetical protein [Chitinophagales bacterium]
MERISKFKVIIFQVLGCLLLYHKYKHWLPILIGLLLIVLTLIKPTWSLAYIRRTEQILAKIGSALQVILFLFLFFVILTPLAVIKRLFERQHAFEREKNTIIQPMDLEKMW